MSLAIEDNTLHFTYNECDKSSLKQGDILAKTPELLALLSEVHPFYTEPEYKFFQVLTQSCDLVKRNGDACKSRYITLAAVRSLDDVINRILQEKGNHVEVDGVVCCSDKDKQRICAFLESLFNNQEKEYFFLHRSPKHDINEHCCTFLYLSIALRSYEHYNLCLEAKRLELKDNFQSKLGWLVGNLYSRVGTDDYVPTAVATKEELKKDIEKILENHASWIPSHKFEDFRKLSRNHNDIKEITNLISAQIKSKTESRLTTILNKLKKIVTLQEGDEEKLKNFIQQDSTFKKLLS